MSKATLKAAIFDLDGVITNTVDMHFRAWKKMFGEYGIDFTWDDYKKKVDGILRADGARAVFKDFNEPTVEMAAARKQRYFLNILKDEKIKVYQSSIDMVMMMLSRGIKVAIISSSKSCEYILDRLDLINMVSAVVSGRDVTKGKPDPQIFLMAADIMGIKPADCVVFEDAELGVLAAKNAGMFCVGIDRYNEKARLSKADIVVNDLEALPLGQIMEEFGKQK